jgi:hypothetical protein
VLQAQSDPCFTYLQGEDIVDHILTQCTYGRQVWFNCFRELNLQIMVPQHNASLDEASEEM